MKKLAKIVLSLALVLTVLASATNYQAADNAKLTYANNYDWSAQTNQVYVFAGEDASATIATLTAQSADTFAWFYTVVLKDNGNGAYTVEAVGNGADTGAISKGLAKGTVIIMAHDLIVDEKASLEWLKTLVAGDTVSISASWSELVAAQATPVNFTVSKGAASSGTTTGTTTTTPSTNVPSTGDNTPVVVMASMLLAAVGCVALGLKKRNA